jgi:predicted O-methyltransferase YrrM
LKVGDLLTAYRHTRLYQRWDDERGLNGRPDPLPTLPFSRLADRLRWGPLGRYIWESRRVRGWTRGEEAVRLARAAYDLPKDAVIVEIGSFLGCSTVLLAGARQIRESGRVHCVDTFDASGDEFSVPIYRTIRDSEKCTLRERFERNIERSGLRSRVEIHPGKAAEMAANWAGPIDLLFFDGDQSREGVRAAYEAWEPFLKDGGTLVLHNSRPGYRREGHDGHAVLAEELVRAPLYGDVEHVGTTTFARRLVDRAVATRPASSG